MPDLKDGESTEMKGSGAKPYVIKNVGGVYSCTCPSWRNTSKSIDVRTCKHIRKLRGDAAEDARLGVTSTNEKPIEPPKKEKPPPAPVLLAEEWTPTVDPTNWWASEKLDGVRAYWDGKRFISRLGNEYFAPEWFLKAMPKGWTLDGELWIGRKKFQETVSLVRRLKPDDEAWKQIKFMVFDAPTMDLSFEERTKFLNKKLKIGENLQLLKQTLIQNVEHLRTLLKEVEDKGGEGLMLRQSGSMYEVGRSRTLLKVKTFFDAEAVVTGHEPGKGKHKGRLGALYVKNAEGIDFKLGTGFSDAQRENPPPIGATVTYSYQELTKDRVPRFPAFVRVRED